MVSIERATANDAEEMMSLKVRAFSEEFRFYGACSIPPQFNSLERQVRTINVTHYFKILKNDLLVGGICIADRGGGYFTLESFYVDLAHQNRGIGNEVMKLIERMFPQARRWSLETPYLSYKNHRFYEKFGFRKINETVPDFAKGLDYRLFVYEKIVNR
jgi:GNAT superfamily N-acetyltransferase